MRNRELILVCIGNPIPIAKPTKIANIEYSLISLSCLNNLSQVNISTSR